jgi:hypothetical protein
MASQDKRIIGFKLTDEIIRQVQDEANTERLWPAHVVEQRLRHSFAVSPRLPGDSTKRRTASSR